MAPQVKVAAAIAQGQRLALQPAAQLGSPPKTAALKSPPPAPHMDDRKVGSHHDVKSGEVAHAHQD